MAETFFKATNTLALVAWIALVVLPHRRSVSATLCGIVVPTLLASAYVGVIGWQLTSDGPPPADVMTIAGLQTLFRDDWVFAAAWTHYLAFDLAVGAWIARDSVRLGIPWPVRSLVLVLTFLAGPAGFLVHVVARTTRQREIAVSPRD
ncbi:MAG: DUF4281 domain-containing protein [Planctomycetes bacterium]|nr:DUF4281 domain-containing protein [Planctomycetota bacterium]